MLRFFYGLNSREDRRIVLQERRQRQANGDLDKIKVGSFFSENSHPVHDQDVGCVLYTLCWQCIAALRVAEELSRPAKGFEQKKRESEMSRILCAVRDHLAVEAHFPAFCYNITRELVAVRQFMQSLDLT